MKRTTRDVFSLAAIRREDHVPVKRRTLVEIENRSGSSLAMKVRAYQAHTLVNLRSCFLLRAEKAREVLAMDRRPH